MSTALDHVRPVASPSRIGQGTAVEQSRAIAEVQAQVIVAQQMPRNVDVAVAEVMRSCAQRSLAEKAFWRYPRGGQQLTGESIILAKELARCWGNIQYGLAELRRDDDAGESEMMAFAWDVQTNARPSTTFIVPHVLDTTNGRKRLADVRDIYENNANMGSRRMREMILNVLPPWLIEDAKAACYATLAADDRDGGTLAERAATAVARYEKIGVRADQLVRKVGAPQARWSAGDLAQLAVIWRSIERGEATADAEFGPSPARVSAADVTGQQPEAKATGTRQRRQAAPKGGGDPLPPPPQDPPDDPGTGGQRPALASPGQVGAIRGHFERLGYQDNDDDRASRLRATARLAQVETLGTTKELTDAQAALVLRTLASLPDVHALHDLLGTGEASDE